MLFQMLEAEKERRPSHVVGCTGRREETSEQALWLEAVGLRAEAWLRISAVSQSQDRGLALLSSLGVLPGFFHGRGPSGISGSHERGLG